MDTCPDFIAFLNTIENKDQKKHALTILKHVWGLLDKQEQRNLFNLFQIYTLKDQKNEEAKEELEECLKEVKEHPEVLELFNKFYTKVITPVSTKDHFKNDRIQAASGIEKGIKELQQKHLIKNFDIKRVG